MPAVYLDSSALVKLVVAEPESEALRRFLPGFTEHFASTLAEVEIFRALLATAAGGETLAMARRVLSGVGLLAMSRTILAEAARIGPRNLRTLDAIHLCTALSLPGISGIVVYDDRLGHAAAAAGLTVWAPGRA